MKRYVKPDVYYEDFELSRNVASCSSDRIKETNFHNGDTCEADQMGGVFLFSNNNSECTVTINSTGYEGYCYQTGSGDYNYFGS